LFFSSSRGQYGGAGIRCQELLSVRANNDIVGTNHEDKEWHLVVYDDSGTEAKGVAYTDAGVPFEFRFG
jgi:hypothetical protein